MMKKKTKKKAAKKKTSKKVIKKVAKKQAKSSVNGVSDLLKELFQAAVTLRGAIEPADYKRYVLPIILAFIPLTQVV